MLFPFLETQTQGNKLSNNEYDIDFTTNRITGKKVTGIEAVKAWISKALKTQRYLHDVYTWDYAQDLNELIGQGYNEGFILSECERRIRETLLINPKITDCVNFTISFNHSILTVNFTVLTIFGGEDIQFVGNI